MPKQSPVNRLDHAIEMMLGRPGPSRRAGPPRRRGSRTGSDADASIAPLLQIAGALRELPCARFRAQLKADLERTAQMTMIRDATGPAVPEAVRQTATARLRVRNAAAAIDFYTRAFGAQELMRFTGGGQIAHAELTIGNSVIMLGEEAPEYGYPSPEALGGSPVGMHLYVDDADGFAKRAVAAGARLVTPVSDQFYGDRSGQVADPFGYSWTIATRTKDMSVEEMQRNMADMQAQQAQPTASTFIPKGFHTVTPYLVVQDAPALIEFVKRVFGAEEAHRATGSAGGIHAEVQIGDSKVMIGGGAPNLSWRGATRPTALHIYVKDTDAAFARAVEAGAAVIQGPTDQEYGERSAGVKDAFGNTWYIATWKGANYVPEGLHTVNVYLHPLRAEPVIAFLKRAFGADAIEKYASPEGVVHHAKVRIGDSAIEMGEAHGPYQPMPTQFYLYVPDADAAYHRALTAGATSLSAPADQPYGDRNAGVKDVFGNEWYIATQIRERQ
jgi:PhnB protein